MFPWGHAAVAYLLYSGHQRRSRRDLTTVTVVTVLVASQLPDLIDKPLAWHLAVLPSGRSLAHSLLTGSLILGTLVAVLLALEARRLVAPLAIGAVSHSLADALRATLAVNPADLTFLAWPVLPTPSYDGPESVLGHFASIDPLAPFVLFQFLLVALALVVWHRDGRPGLAPIRIRARSLLNPRG